MTLKFRQLRLRAVTADGIYGADVPFDDGLTVLWADNTKGKSTCIQGMLYALGLEKMLSPRRDIPLPHAMTSYLNTDDERKIDVLASRVSLEIENGAGQVITVNRNVKGETDTRLIEVDFGPSLTTELRDFRRQNYFVRDPGAAQREDGFHHFLEGFIGWTLPEVRRYDAPETKLYLETVFPLFWVEQKFGWSTIPAAIPTYMHIREVQKRAVEFIMDLDVYKLELQRERLAEKLADNAKNWAAVHEGLVRFALRSGGRVVALSERPVAETAVLNSGHIEMAEGVDWIPLNTMVSRFRKIAADLVEAPVPEVADQVGTAAQRLDELTARADYLNAQKISLHGVKQLKASDILSLQRRIRTLTDDLAKNLDVQKLQTYAGTIGALTPDRCPTCEQALLDTLMSQNALTAVMPIADNIEYIRAQKKMFEDILLRERAEENERESSLSAIGSELGEVYAQIRMLKSELVAPGSNPSAAAIEERIRAERRVVELEEIQTVLEDTVERLKLLQADYVGLLGEQSKLPKEKLSPQDRSKLNELTILMQQQAKEFGFKTFSPTELSISEDSYRPEKEGYEIGFETSASDAIRLKWAYQLGLLELASGRQTNHPNLLVFDEPRQQSSSKVSFESLLRRAAGSKKRNQQVIFSTSEDLDTLKSITSAIECKEVIFSGYILQKLD